MRTFLQFRATFFVLLVILAAPVFPTGCTSGQGALDELRAQAAAAQQAPATPTLTPTGQLAPAPAEYTQAQAKAYYLEQLRQAREGGPRKLKNSHNVTNEVTQQFHAGLSTWQLLAAALLVWLFGAACGLLARRPTALLR